MKSPADTTAELPWSREPSPALEPTPSRSVASEHRALALSRALLEVELGSRIAEGGNEAAIQAVAEVVAKALDAVRLNARAGTADTDRGARGEGEEDGAAHGPERELRLSVHGSPLPDQPLAFRRAMPFTELEQILAQLAVEKLEAALEQSRLSQELVDCRSQLEQSERLKSVGQLASGIAHDFNNLLMVISAAAEVIGDGIAPEHPFASQLSLILETSHRAAELTRKLLRFSRKARSAMKPVDVHEVLGTVGEFLAHGIDRRIKLSLSLCEGPCIVLGDATQLGNAVLNVCLNARDAMPEGGSLKIATSRVELDAEACAARFHGCEPGHYVRLDIRDTGTGMDEKTLARAFEPFFTTKGPERGTGLGLPVVQAAVREHKGNVLLESMLGRGTSCSILLPLSESALAESSSNVPDSRRMAALRVLLVDDEPGVCLTAAQLMRQLGHNVQALCSGEKALNHLRVHSSGYDLLVLDVMMPHPTGLEVRQALRDEGIDLPTIFVSGSNDPTPGGDIEEPSGAVLLAKPFRQSELALAIARCMEAWQSRNRAAAAAALRAG
jgi:signal transduction histidine kinase/CheY-like chemotaxis protein